MPQNTETAAVKPRVGVKGSPRGVCSLLKWQGREHERSRPFLIKRGTRNAERGMSVERCAIGSAFAVPHSALSTGPRASLRNRVSKTQSTRGSTEAACQIANRKS